MKKILLFGGASETHALLEAFDKLPVSVTLSVASDYGRALLPPESGKLHLLTGTLDQWRMAALMRDGCFCAVIDATHPYAAEASANIRAAATQNGLPCLRLLREASDTAESLLVAGAAQAVEKLNQRQGAVLLTTGSKELRLFADMHNYKKRLYARVLPVPEALAACAEIGLPPDHIIAMRGPFSARLNVALLREFAIQTLVTKDGGVAGGFPEKLQAAREVGCEVILLRRPEESGLNQEQLLVQLKALIEE